MQGRGVIAQAPPDIINRERGVRQANQFGYGRGSFHQLPLALVQSQVIGQAQVMQRTATAGGSHLIAWYRANFCHGASSVTLST